MVPPSRRYAYAADPRAFQLWAPLEVRDADHHGVLLAHDDDDLTGRFQYPIDLRRDEASGEVVVKKHMDDTDFVLERHQASELALELRPGGCRVGETLLWNASRLHASDVFDDGSGSRLALTARCARPIAVRRVTIVLLRRAGDRVTIVGRIVVGRLTTAPGLCERSALSSAATSHATTTASSTTCTDRAKSSSLSTGTFSRAQHALRCRQPPPRQP